MQNDVFIFFYFNARRRHKPMARACPIARIYVHVFAEQAFRAVICIPVSHDIRFAVFANEVFDRPLELFVHAGMIQTKKLAIKRKVI